MKTAIYVRVSTEEQVKEGYSIRAQIEKLKNFITIKDWDFYKVYADEGISGKNTTDRPAINQLINDIKTGKVNNVLVYKIDRLTRNTKDLIELTEIFKEYDCSFNSVMESIDTTTASGRMFLKIIGIFAEFERENIIERITLAFEKKAKEGYTLSKNIQSYGYDRAIGEKIQRINLEEAEIVKEIFTMYVDGNMSQNAIAQNLNHRGIKSKLGTSWGNTSIKKVLTNSTYIGKVRYSVDDKTRYFEADGKHEPILSEELFYEAQNKIGKIQKKGLTKRPKEDHYFSGTIYCGLCDSRLKTHGSYTIDKTGAKHIKGSYQCPKVAKGLCNNPTFSHAKAETAFLEHMNNIPDITVADDVNLEEKSKQDNINAMLQEEYENAISKLEKKEKDIMSLYINERINFSQYEQMVKIVSSEKHSYIEQLNNFQPEPSEDIIITREEIITNFRENWTFLTKKEKLQFLQTYIEKITAVSEKEKGYQVKVLKIEFYKN